MSIDLNRANIITLSRIILTFVAAGLLFSKIPELIIISYAVIGLVEVSDVLDGYIARRDNLVSDFGKIFDPLSDSIARFFCFFALAYNGLFPIWFLTLFFLRDITVAYLRIYVALTGVAMGARISGKVKGAFQFAGQYLLIALLVSQVASQVSIEVLNYTLILGVLSIFALIFGFRVRGNMLILLSILTVLLAVIFYAVTRFELPVSAEWGRYIAIFVLAGTMYSLFDYFFSVIKVKSSAVLIWVFTLISIILTVVLS